MIRPARFGFNPQTAASNHFQQENADSDVQQAALEEFDRMTDKLRSHGARLLVLQDTPEAGTPDSVFPNNWFSTHDDGTLVLYPMCAPNRRAERKPEVIKSIMDACGTRRVVDLSFWENDGKFLESTGSMVLDRESKTAYACLSSRTSEEVLQQFCSKMGYTSVVFHAVDGNGLDIYHTNVVMAMGNSFAVICREAIHSAEEWETLEKSLKDNGKTIIEISLDQVSHYAGNMLEVTNERGERLLLMSESAWNVLSTDQLAVLSHEDTIVPISIPVIEEVGGGSVRCMMAELYEACD